MGACQIYKIIESLIAHKKLDTKILFTSGGMPSSHTASVISLSTAIGIQEGIHSAIFHACLIFASIVIYDAVGIRQAAGRQAEILNEVVKASHSLNTKLKEQLGHTPMEVMAGALFGIAVAIGINLWLT